MTFLAFVTKVQASHYTSISLQYVETLTVLRHIILYSYIMGSVSENINESSDFFHEKFIFK